MARGRCGPSRVPRTRRPLTLLPHAGVGRSRAVGRCRSDLASHPHPAGPVGPTYHDAMSMGCALLDRLPHRTYNEGDAHVVELEITDEIRGPVGAVHGGLIASLVDRVGAYAAVRASGRNVVTSTVTLSYLAAATGDRSGPPPCPSGSADVRE